MTFGARRFFSLLSMILILVLMVFAFRYDAGRRVDGMKDLMVAQGRSLADVIAESSLHGLGLYNSLENETNQRLRDNAVWIARMDSIAGLDSTQLQQLLAGMRLEQALVFGPEGELLAVADEALRRDPELQSATQNLIEPLLSGERSSTVLGRRTPSAGSGRWWSAASSRVGGGAVVVGTRADSLPSSPAELGPGRMIKALGEGQGISYVVIQDNRGIQASSTDKVGFPLPGEDPVLRPLAEGQPYVSREYVSAMGPVVEVARVVSLGDRTRVLLRVGLDASLLNEMRRDGQRRTIMRALFLGASLVLFSSLLLAWQRQAVLNRDVARVTGELRDKEEEVRRGAKLVAMGTLAAGVAHQVRNPLNSIHMISQVLGRSPDVTEKVRDELRHITDESGRIESIVQQFLLFTKPREPVFESFDLGIVVRESVAVQSAAGRAQSIEFITDPPRVDVELDRQFVIEILENLLRNSVDALDGEGRVEVTVQSKESDVVIHVADNGPGISAADRERIFDLYYTSRPEGHGLGLSLATQMVSSMDGSLHVADGPGLDGKGVRFAARFPRIRSNR
jgi:signal transduction histidine kinase